MVLSNERRATSQFILRLNLIILVLVLLQICHNESHCSVAFVLQPPPALRQNIRSSRQNHKVVTSFNPPKQVSTRIPSQQPQRSLAYSSSLFVSTSIKRTSIRSSSSSSSSNRDSSNPKKFMNKVWTLIQSKKQLWLLPTLAVLLLPRWVGRWSLDSLNFLFETLPWKKLAKIVIVVWVVISILSTIHTNRRQALDATSEWSRYAERPAARGRAILWLLVQQAFLILIARITSGLLRFKDRATIIRQKAGRNFSNGLLKLGPLYIKLGQIVSCRKGLLGKEWIDAMADLQDRVPARTGQDALELAYATLQGGQEEFDRLFFDFDSTPLAAASLGQVHKAKLQSTYRDVAVKVQRPYLRQIYDQDFVLLTTIAQFMDKLPGTSKNVGGVKSSWTQIFVDAEDILYREIDYRDEAENAMRFAHDFGLGLGGNATTPTALNRNNKTMPSAAEWLRTPYVYSDLSNERLLVMEYVPSIKITNRAKLDASNVTEEDRIELADNLARAYLIQFCCNMFFSTDPHPGNLGVEMIQVGHRAEDVIVPTMELTGPRKPRLVMYDFGQAATLNRNQADGILEIIEAIVDMDVARSVSAFQKMGVLVDNANLDEVRDKVAENYRTGKVKANRKKLRRKGFQFRNDVANGDSNEAPMSLELSESATSKSNDAKVMSYFSLPAEYAFVARAISQMDGVGKSLDPEFDFISSAAPYLVEVKGADLYLKDEVVKLIRGSQAKITKFQRVTLPKWWKDVTSGI